MSASYEKAVYAAMQIGCIFLQNGDASFSIFSATFGVSGLQKTIEDPERGRKPFEKIAVAVAEVR